MFPSVSAAQDRRFRAVLDRSPLPCAPGQMVLGFLQHHGEYVAVLVLIWLSQMRWRADISYGSTDVIGTNRLWHVMTASRDVGRHEVGQALLAQNGRRKRLLVW